MPTSPKYKPVVQVCDEFVDSRSFSLKKHINSGLHFLGENAAIGAIYNSLERQQLDAPKCHPKTRVAVIDRIIDWLNGDIDYDALLLWLYGAAGAGKSAIAHSLAEICEKYVWRSKWVKISRNYLSSAATIF